MENLPNKVWPEPGRKRAVLRERITVALTWLRWGSEKVSGDLWSFANLKFISRTIFSLSCVVPSAGTEKVHLKGVERFSDPPRLATLGWLAYSLPPSISSFIPSIHSFIPSTNICSAPTTFHALCGCWEYTSEQSWQSPHLWEAYGLRSRGSLVK